MLEKIVVAVVSACVGGVLTYGMKAVQMEGRLEGIERAVIRIESNLSNRK